MFQILFFVCGTSYVVIQNYFPLQYRRKICDLFVPTFSPTDLFLQQLEVPPMRLGTLKIIPLKVEELLLECELYALFNFFLGLICVILSTTTTKTSLYLVFGGNLRDVTRGILQVLKKTNIWTRLYYHNFDADFVRNTPAQYNTIFQN